MCNFKVLSNNSESLQIYPIVVWKNISVQVLKWHLGPAESQQKEQKMKKKKKQQAEKD